MIFDHIKECNDKLVILNGDNLIEVFLDIGEDLVARLLYRSTVGNSAYMWKLYYMARFK